MRGKVARSSWREATRIFSIAETAAGRAGVAPTLRSRGRPTLQKLPDSSPNRGHTKKSREEIASAPRPLVCRDLSGVHACAIALCSGDSRAKIDPADLADGQWKNARRFSRRFRFAP